MQVSNVKGGNRQSRRQEIRRKAHFDLDSRSSSSGSGTSCYLTIASTVPDCIKSLFSSVVSNKTCAFGVVHINKLVSEFSKETVLDSLGLQYFDVKSGCKRNNFDTKFKPLLLDILFPIRLCCLENLSSPLLAPLDDSQCVSLLSIAIKLRRDVIVSALIRACANPFTFNINPCRVAFRECNDSKNVGNVHHLLSDCRRSTTLTAFIWLLYQIDQLKCKIEGEYSCSLCGDCCYQCDSFLCLRPCHHCVCLVCLWENIQLFTGDCGCSSSSSTGVDYYSCNVNSLLSDCLYCPVCRSTVGNSSTDSVFRLAANPQLNKMTSLQKWLALPESLACDAAVSSGCTATDDKLKFRALSPSQSAYYSLGTSQAQRTMQLFKCVVENNARRLLALIDKGVCLDLVNHYHMTALCVAVMMGHCEVIVVLLRSGADIFLNNAAEGSCRGGAEETSNGCYLLDIARHFQYDKVERILLQYLKEHYHNYAVPQQCRLNLTLENSVLWSASSVVRWLVPVNTVITCTKGNKELVKPHPGAGRSFIIDHVFTDQYIDYIVHLFAGLPVAKKVKDSCSDRTYYCDIMGQLTEAIERVVELMLSRSIDAGDANASPELCASKKVEVFPSMKLLNYTDVGGTSSPHIDLNKSSILTQHHSMYTFILYTSDCGRGGQTVLLRSVKETWTMESSKPISDNILACVAPRRGRLLVFPHSCPHAGLPTIDTPKTLLRGEILIEQ